MCPLFAMLLSCVCLCQVFYYQEAPYPPMTGRFKGHAVWSGDIMRQDVSITLHEVPPTFNGTYSCQVRNPPDVHGSNAEIDHPQSCRQRLDGQRCTLGRKVCHRITFTGAKENSLRKLFSFHLIFAIQSWLSNVLGMYLVLYLFCCSTRAFPQEGQRSRSSLAEQYSVWLKGTLAYGKHAAVPNRNH